MNSAIPPVAGLKTSSTGWRPYRRACRQGVWRGLVEESFFEWRAIRPEQAPDAQINEDGDYTSRWIPVGIVRAALTSTTGLRNNVGTLEFSEPSLRHASPVLKGQLGDVAFASHSAQAVPSGQGREIGAIEKHRTIESQEIHSR